MPTDAFMITALCRELDSGLCGGKINKITQPEADEVILTVYTKGGKTVRLLISCGANYPRLHLTSLQKENPSAPYQFCMTLRKHLASAEIVSITNIEYERVAEIEFSCLSEMKDSVKRRLIIEIMGRQSNMMLCDENHTIIMPLKTVSLDSSASRKILSGLKYLPPVSDKVKINDETAALNRLDEFTGGSLPEFLAANFMGMSKITAEHIAYSVGEGFSKKKIFEAFNKFENDLLCGIKPCILKKGGENADYLPFPYFDQSGDYVFFPTLSECSDSFFLLKDSGKRLTDKKKNLLSAIKGAAARAEKKAAILTEKLSECENAEKLKQYGELLTSNLYKLKGGEKNITVQNYFDDNCSEITIELDENLTPSKNAQRFFKKYSKLKTAKETSLLLLEETAKLCDYYASLRQFTENSQNLTDLEEINSELIEAGILKSRKDTSNKKPKAPNIIIKDVFGCKMFCGKNNIQNEYITFKIAKPNDLWFHIKDYHGPHVVLSPATSAKIGEEALLAAAKAACVNVKGGKTAVDYTYKKFVKKTPGANKGNVIYTNYKTIFVDTKTE